MKCPRCSWTGSFKSYGAHQARAHRRALLKQLAKARTPVARARAAETRRRKKAAEAAEAPGTRKGKKTSRRSRRAENASNDAPECPPGFVIETVTFRRA